MRRLSLVVSILVLAVGACSNDSPKAASPRRGTSLIDKLVRASDLPADFKRISVEERDPDASTNDYCGELDQHRRNFPGSRVGEAQFRRTTGTATTYVNEQITKYANEAEATRAFEDFQKALDQCGSVTKKDDTTSISGTFEPVEFVEVGDDSYATTFSATQTVDEDSASISGYFVTWRARGYVVLLSVLGTIDTPAKSSAESIAKRAVSRI